MKHISLLLISLAMLFLGVSCTTEEEQPVKGKTLTKSSVDGVIQKGPFINGSSVTLYELSDSLVATGKVYDAQISDNYGSFQIDDITLSSQYVKLKADGFYFNEVTGKNSASRITLYALSDLENKSTVNVNILSHLEYQRVEYLISKGLTFESAKKQAETEVLKFFSIIKEDIQSSESLNISDAGEDNAILLALSVIIQGYRNEADLSDLLANIISDFKNDGVLNSQELGTLLINDAKLLDLPTIRKNMEDKYALLDNGAVIPDFEKYVNQFVTNSGYVFTKAIEYPKISAKGVNVLYGDSLHFTSMSTPTKYSLSANVPVGASLKIVIKNGQWYYGALPLPVNWTISTYDDVKQEQVYTVTTSGENADVVILFEPGSHTIEYYENNALTPTRVKQIVVTDDFAGENP